jgi:precorrin-6A/cobalt-precorrin-6A reductase
VRIGGFGGVEGLQRWLAAPVDAVVDTTHPFAATITANAAGMSRAGPPTSCWPAQPGRGTSIVVGSDLMAAKSLLETAVHGVIHHRPQWGAPSPSRCVVPDQGGDPARRRCDAAAAQLLLSAAAATRAEPLARHRIDALVTKNGSGDMTRGKPMPRRSVCRWSW